MQKSSVAVLVILAVMMLGSFVAPSCTGTGRMAWPRPVPVRWDRPHWWSQRGMRLPPSLPPEWCSPERYWSKHSRPSGASIARSRPKRSTRSSTAPTEASSMSASYTSATSIRRSTGIASAQSDHYNALAIPDVFFDGGQAVNGQIGTLPVMENAYRDNINNASMVPGNVSIAQTASVSSGTISLHANITSGLTGTYQVITYLLEYIGKNDTSVRAAFTTSGTSSAGRWRTSP